MGMWGCSWTLNCVRQLSCQYKKYGEPNTVWTESRDTDRQELLNRHYFISGSLNPWRNRLWRTLAGWAAAAGSLSRLHQTVLGWHVVSTSNPTAAFSAFQTGPLLLYSSNYSVYPTPWTPFQTQLPQKSPKECPGIEPGTSVFVVCNAND
jgi:hypothetical protein